MTRLAWFVAFAVFFYIANHGATKGYFDGDDLDNLNMTDQVSPGLFATTFLTPRLDQSNFRPVGHAFYHYFGRRELLNYPSYVYFIQAVHLLNVVLLWLVLRALGFEPLNAAFGLLFFAFNMGTFDIYWKPMYVFDLFCATFTLASLLLWLGGRWIWSWVAFWCAFKSKEVAIALPMVLLLLEFVRGTRRWKQLVPFFLVSINFGVQAILGNRGRDNAYTLRFTLDAFRTCVAYYGNRVLVIPFGGALVIALSFLRDKRAWLGLAALILFMGPMFFLPGRLFGAYLYVPLVGLAIAGSAFSVKAGRLVSLVLVLLWLPWNYREMRVRRKEHLALSDENRAYTDKVLDLIRKHPALDSFVFDRSPEGLHSWGVRAAVSYALRPRHGFKEAEIRSNEALALAGEANLAYLLWNPATKKLTVLPRAGSADIPYIRMNDQTPLWQLGEGWHGVEGNFQWTNLTAKARVARPAGATRLEVLVNVGPELVGKLKKVRLEVLVDGVKVGEQEFATPGWRTLAFGVPAASRGSAEVQFNASPGYFYEHQNPVGIAVGGFGFPTEQYPAAQAPR